MARRSSWAACVFPLLAACSRDAGPPFPPHESLRRMRLEPGFRIELFASEPDVAAPVAMDWDEDGRIWVVENPGYPLNVEGRVGKVKLLEDVNGDGRIDKSSVFADQLVLPTGVMRWKKGVLVTDAPDLLYFEDTNGDGKSDLRRAVLTGFAFTNPQHTVSSPLYGLDNWIYLAHENPTTAIIFRDKFGDRGGDIRFAEGGARVIERGRNIRFRPDTGRIEALSGTSQFGHTFDEYGRHFTLNNTYHARHEVIAARYLKRNPDLAVSSAQEDIPGYGRPAKVFSIAPRQRFEMLTNTGEFTSACGLTWYLGGALPASNSLFVAEPVHNLVHRAVVTAKGATFRASRVQDNVEFLASTDSWFRPVNFYTGPDGALYLLDYYRLVIEHPEWMSQSQSQTRDLMAGTNLGRIYRIIPDGHRPGIPAVRLSAASDTELVRHLESPNIWWRRTAQRLLVDRKAVSAAPGIERLYRQSRSGPARVHALWTLEGLGKLNVGVIETALEDVEPGVRENAIVLAESRLDQEPRLALRISRLADDASARVRFQALASLGFVPHTAAVRDKILERDIGDRWVHVAALSAGPGEALRIWRRATRSGTVASPDREALVRAASSAIGTRKQANAIEAVLAETARAGGAWWRRSTLEGLAQGIRGGLDSPAARRTLLDLFSAGDTHVRTASLRVMESIGLDKTPRAILERAARDASTGVSIELRADSIALLGLEGAGPWRSRLEELSGAGQPEAVRVAAVRALGRIPGPEAGRFLISSWRAFTAPVRAEAVDALYRDPGRIPLVVGALESGAIPAWTLAFRHKRQLIMHRDEKIRAAARALLATTSAARATVVERYRPALDRRADPARGKAVFESVCAKCHQLDGRGSEVGPDLATVRGQPAQVLLEEILDPHRAISQGFEAYVVETHNGVILDGVLGGETPAAITLRREEGKQDVIARKDIREIRVAELSAMPADLENQVSPERMADLIAYIRSPPMSSPARGAPPPP